MWIAGLLLTVLIVIVIIVYNRLVRDSHTVRTAWSDIDVQLKRRHDLIPQLVATVQQYADFEQATLERVTSIRQQSVSLQDLAAKSGLEAELGEHLQRLLVVAEAYPELKADQAFLDLQQNLSDVENHLQYARRYYNGAVSQFNIRVDSFPDLLVAQLFRFRKAQWFQFEQA